MDSIQAEILIKSLEGKSIGGWAIDGKFGFGKSAVVMRASKDGREGAVKVFHPELIERYGEGVQLERIARECSLIGAKHPNLVEIYDGGKCSESGHLFVVMEAVPYKNLRELLQDIPFPSIRPIIAQVAQASMFLEERGLAHRDIKPENIAVSPDFQTVKLLDLGVLRPFGEADLTDVDHRPFIGTLRYSSPEFLQRKEDDSPEGWRAVTFYQLGAVLHDLLMKKEIFSEYSAPYSVLVQAVLEKVPEVFGGDPSLVRLCNHCLTKSPKTRCELVSWTNFVRDDHVSNAAESIKARIKGRQKYFQNLLENGAVAGSEVDRLIKHQIQELCNRFCARVGIVLNTLQCFPLRKIESEIDDERPACHVFIHFEKDKNIGLIVRLALKFEIELADQNNGRPIYSVATCAAVSTNEMQVEQLNSNKKFFVGEAEELMSNALLEQYFLGALDAAYECLDTRGRNDAVNLAILSV